MTPILQKHLPFAPWTDPRTARLPGVIPVEGDDWLRVDDAFAGQMAERDRLIRDAPDKVHALLPGGRAAAEELYHAVLDRLHRTDGYTVSPDAVTRPDGVTVPLDRDQPLPTLGRLVQEDLCLMQAAAAGHVLTGAILCFPASWTLAQKIGRPLTGIHAPVQPYTDDIARRVQRMFNAVRAGQPLVRMNALVYDDPTLHQPRLETERRPKPLTRIYMRSERQCLMRLPATGAVVFSIHTYVVRITDLSDAAQAALPSAGL
jgi:dimethylamine monooxygenase subunit A